MVRSAAMEQSPFVSNGWANKRYDFRPPLISCFQTTVTLVCCFVVLTMTKTIQPLNYPSIMATPVIIAFWGYFFLGQNGCFLLLKGKHFYTASTHLGYILGTHTQGKKQDTVGAAMAQEIEQLSTDRTSSLSGSIPDHCSQCVKVSLGKWHHRW